MMMDNNPRDSPLMQRQREAAVALYRRLMMVATCILLMVAVLAVVLVPRLKLGALVRKKACSHTPHAIARRKTARLFQAVPRAHTDTSCV